MPILQQFGLVQQQMQQQMMEQFQQTMMSMMQMFTKMHDDQTDLIRQELESMRRLTEELLEAKKQLAETAAGGMPAARPAPTVTPIRAEGGSAPPTPPPQPLPVPYVEPATTGPANSNHADVHGWLSHRIAGLEKERQTVWQRILGSMAGR